MTTPSTIEAQRRGLVKALDPQENAYRLEIDEFVQDTPVLNLFLLALEALQDNRVLNPTEQTARRHGRNIGGLITVLLVRSCQSMLLEENSHEEQVSTASPAGRRGYMSIMALPTNQGGIVNIVRHYSLLGIGHMCL